MNCRNIEWNEHTFRKIRSENLNFLKEKLENCGHSCDQYATNQKTSDDRCIDGDESIRSFSNRRQSPELIIIDDIMYLRSMRRQIYVLARSFNVPILTVISYLLIIKL